MHDLASRRAFPFLDSLEADAEALRAEIDSVEDEHWAPMSGYQVGCVGFVLYAGRWSAEFPNADLAANRARCPNAASYLDRIEGVELAGFMRLLPGALMHPHTDPRDDNLVRCILGLRLTAEEQAWWPEGAARLLDTRQSHWARNTGSHPRTTFVIDVRMPFAVPTGSFGSWRPGAPA